MGLSKITRFKLFQSAYERIVQDDRAFFINRDIVADLYRDSAQTIKGFEEEIISESSLLTENDFLNRLDINLKGVDDSRFVAKLKQYITIQQESFHKKKESLVPYNEMFHYLLKFLMDYQRKVLDSQFVIQKSIDLSARKATFLSYAMDDKGLTLAFFYYFEKNDAYLYVDWMLESSKGNGRAIEKELERALTSCDQLLFLRTSNSEFRMKGYHQIRQWCAWELGFFYSLKDKQRYYTSFYDKEEPKNEMLDAFKPFVDISKGVVK